MDAGEARVLTQLRRGALEYCVLALLRRQPGYGLDLVRVLSETEGLLTSEGTIYPLLSRLRKEGMVSTTWQESATGPPRRYYTLTDHGNVALDRFIEDWNRFANGVDALLGQGPRAPSTKAPDPSRPVPSDGENDDDRQY